MVMTAEEMFKKEGYERLTEDNLKSFVDTNNPKDSLELSLKYNLITYIKKASKYRREICFNTCYCINALEQWEDGQLTDINLSLDLLDAINKQAEELKENGEW